VSLRHVQARLNVIQGPLLEQSVPLRYNEAQRRDYPAHKIVALPAGPGANSNLKERFGDPIWVILAICGAVLLIACVNLATRWWRAACAGRRRSVCAWRWEPAAHQ
jgi:hypothetical protein